jgi:hypothetical protein
MLGRLLLLLLRRLRLQLRRLRLRRPAALAAAGRAAEPPVPPAARLQPQSPCQRGSPLPPTRPPPQ